MLITRGAVEAESASQNVAPHGLGPVRRFPPRHTMTNARRGLETPALTVSRDLSHADAPQLFQEDEGAGVRVTASHSSQITLGEGHLQFAQDH